MRTLTYLNNMTKLGKQLIEIFNSPKAHKNKPVVKEFKRQKANMPCSHLKGTYKQEGQITDLENDEVYDVEKEFCNLCGAEITYEIRQEINKRLKNYEEII